ncbi:unnamed protein product [Brassicogethes aeneus]|uniref:Uncharacterized protein n=1 Tax=Brassicogethes aeneus TaxID=1431903 RepID=A0A9P0FEP7_BRAAE|nr:unnamed protein product [Brassicogethes aeneus]
MEPRGKGRARGRSVPAAVPPTAQRPGVPQQQQQGGPPRPAPGFGGPPAPQGAWANRAPQQQQPPRPQHVPQQAPWARQAAPLQAQQEVAGRGTRQGGGGDHAVPPAASGGIPNVILGQGDGGNQDPPGSAGRRGGGGGNGGVRGRATRNEIIKTRPETLQSKCGTSGAHLKLQANYLELIQAGKWCLNQYRVDMVPELDNIGERKGLMRLAMKDVLNGYLFDGTVLYTVQTINPDPLEKFVESANGEKVRITVRRVGDVAWGDYHYIQLFNIIIRKCLHYMKFQLVGRSYYDPTSKIQIHEHKLELWPGYFTSMRQHEKKILMTIDVDFKVLRTDNVYDMMCQSRDARAFQNSVIDSVVLTYYNNKTYRIDDVDFKANPKSTFATRDGGQISYIDYYKQKYNIRIQVEDQPLLVSRSKPREIRAGMPETVILIPELCKLTGLTDRQRENFQLMKSLGNYTRVAPQGRIQKLMEFCQRMRACKEVIDELKRWDLQIANTLIELPGRQLPPEKIFAGNQKQFSAGPQADWTRDLRSAPMLVNADMSRMAVICPNKMARDANDFIGILQKAAQGMSFQIKPKLFTIQRDDINSYLEQIEEVTGMNPTLVMCILPNPTVDRYSAIKKKCTVDRGLPSQVILAKNLTSKGVMSIATKVAIQLNCKIGGAPWSVHMPLPGLMIVGYDVCRDSAKKSKSFGAFVATLDKGATRYINFVNEHEHQEELSNHFATNMILACKAYETQNGVKPKCILIYRDGVGEGQLPFVHEQEVKNIEQKLKQELYGDTEFKMAFVVVSKRINTRIFHKADNPPPGTVVDDVITLPERYDFFIVSQCVRQGTVAPTSYNVIHDTIGLPPDKLQILTYKLTHMYYNWSGTVRVPAPCQYAHKLAFFTAKFLHRQPHRDLANTLFYL